MGGKPIVSATFDHSSIEVEPDGDRMIVDDPAIVTAIKALGEACVVTITVAAEQGVEEAATGRSLGERLKVNAGCKGYAIPSR